MALYVISIILLLSFPMTLASGQSEDSLVALPISPKVSDVNGDELNDTMILGRQIILSADLSKSSDYQYPSVVVFEIIDSNGVTRYVAWQTIYIPQDGTNHVGVSWLAGKAGNYEIKVLHVLTLANPGKIYGYGTGNFTVID